MDDRSVDADVVVVGGGPAGSATAIACAVRGLRVILCEREVSGRHRPGETLHPGIEPLLAQLGVLDRLPQVNGARHAGVWIEWSGPRRFEAFGGDAEGPWHGFQVSRAEFDAMLLDRARALGVQVRERCAATGVLKRADALCAVNTELGDIATTMVVDATGAARWLSRALGIASPGRSPRLIARYGYVQGTCPSRDEAPLLIGDTSGWTWSARVAPDTYQWICVRFGARVLDGMPDELRGLTPLGPERGADVTWRMAEKTAGSGWFLVGDAAATLDPTSSHGVLKALLSGMIAGHLIAASLGNKAPAEEIATAYHSWVREWFTTDALRMRAFYRDVSAVGFAGN